MSKMDKLSIIIPCYNERKTIEELLFKVEKAFLPNGWKKEIIVVDDGSKDGTKEILENYQNKFKIIFKEKNEGKGSALKEGFKLATGNYILIQDADLEYNPNDYILLLEPVIKKGVKLVFGSRLLKKENIPSSKLFFYGGLFLTKFFNFLFNTSLTDITTCYKLFHRDYIDKLITIPNNDFVFDAVYLPYILNLNETIIEVPISYKGRKRKEGKKIKLTDGLKCMIEMLKLKFGLKYGRK